MTSHKPRLRAVFAGPLARTVIAVTATITALLPLTRVLASGPGLAQSALMAALLGVTGLITRGILLRIRRTIRAPLTLIVQLGVLVALTTNHSLAPTSLWGFIPTATTLREATTAGAEGVRQITVGMVPLAQTGEILLLQLVGAGMLFTCLFLLTVSVRLPLIAATITLAIGATPGIIVGRHNSTEWFVLFAILTLAMLLQSTSRVNRPRNQGIPTAFSIGALAIAASVVMAPLVTPSPHSFGSGAQPRLDASLNLGQDLRRPDPVTALTLTTQLDHMPYLRLATLSSYDGTVWHPDEGASFPLNTEIPLAPYSVMGGDRERVNIDIGGVLSSRLPVPYPGISIEGLTGDWLSMRSNGTVFGGNIAGQSYGVTYVAEDPSLSQLQVATSAASGLELSSRELPSGLPPQVAELAALVTQHATTDVQRLLALEEWFRSEFDYSLDAPVAGNFDGTGLDAVEAFLEVRSGYCTHFASTFTLMARSLGMPSRVVVGFLPSTVTSSSEDGNTFTVTSDLMHAWPEVHFEGIGWIAFEPTASLGTATEFVGETAPAELDDETVDEDLDEQPEADAGGDPADPQQNDLANEEDAAAETEANLTVATPWELIALGVAGVALVLFTPGLTRLWIGRRRIARASEGDALAGWDEVRATLRDLGFSHPSSETVRALASRLVRDFGVDQGAAESLASSVESIAYGGSDPAGHDCAEPTRALVAAVRAQAGPARRFVARVVPRSLW